LTFTCQAVIAVVSLSAIPPVIAIPSPSANRSAMNPEDKFTVQGTHATAQGTGIIISGMSVPTVGAVALL